MVDIGMSYFEIGITSGWQELVRNQIGIWPRNSIKKLQDASQIRFQESCFSKLFI